MAGPKVPLVFRLYKGDQFLREERLSLPVIKVGKLSSSHLRLDDESVSRMHAVIEVTGPGDISIIDLGSTKGTFVNGQKVNKAKLQSGDQIVVGDTRIEVSVADSAAEPEAAAHPPANAPAFAPARPPMQSPLASAPPGISPYASQPPSPYQPQPQSAYQSQPPAQAAPAPAPAFRAPAGMPAPFGMGTASPAAFQASMAESIDDMGGSRAVEVAAMLGDSVVQVKHVMNPRGGGVSVGTLGLFGLGAGMIVMAAITFSIAVRNAAYNKGGLDQWTTGDKAAGIPAKPAWSYRPRMLPIGYDWMSFGGLALGLISITWGLSRLRNERSSPYFRIGQAPGVEFPTSQSPSASFAMIAPHGDEFVFNYGHGMDGEMIVDGRSVSFAELQQQGRSRPSMTAPGGLEVQIPPKSKIRARVGNTVFMVSSVAQPRRQTAPLFAMESRVLAYFAGSAAFHLGLWALLRTIPPDPDSALVDLAGLEDVTTDTSSTSMDDPPPPEPEEEDGDEDESGGTGTAMALEEGKMGKKDSDRAEGQYKMLKTQDQEQLARKEAIDAARSAGVLGSTALQQGGAFASLTGTGDVSSGFDDADIMGGLLGNEAGEMAGGFGFGRSGFGPGGGGTGWGTIGTGRYGTIGHGSGTGSGYGVGGGRGGMRGRTSAVPQVRIGQPNAVGDLDKAIIRRYIKRNIAKITYCYEKELLAKPGLAGTVSTQFFISPNGKVSSSRATGVDSNVSSCVAGVIGAIEFPKPKGGGGVQVNYPFTFRPTGG